LIGHTAGVSSLRFAPDGSRLASSSVDASVKIWDHTRGKEALTLLGHEQETTDACFLQDGGLSVLSFGKDRNGIEWPADSWEAAAPTATARKGDATIDGAARDSVR
ncbi:MAG TPA: hypothetical protein VGE52_02430, partial [Pirellulales bacterium]